MNQYCDYKFKIILVGDSNVGKTNLISRFVNKDDDLKHDTTIGVEFTNKMVEYENNRILTQIWDTAGQEKFRSIISSYYRNSMGAMIVYDITNKKSFDNITVWYDELATYCDMDNIPIILIGNKIDLEEKRTVYSENGRNFARENGMLFVETSNMDGTNIDVAFKTLLVEILNNIKNYKNYKHYKPSDNIETTKIFEKTDRKKCTC